ncbi:MAG: PEP-CTERM sorting domain-containing protein [Acidobacteriota bacterium]
MIQCNILSSTLSVFNPAGAYGGPASGVNYDLWDVTTGINSLLGGTGLPATFADLGSGIACGSQLVFPTDMNTNIVIDVNAAALAAIASASVQGTSLFAMGGSPAPAGKVPEPETYAVMGLGLAGLAALRRR